MAIPENYAMHNCGRGMRPIELQTALVKLSPGKDVAILLYPASQLSIVRKYRKHSHVMVRFQQAKTQEQYRVRNRPVMDANGDDEKTVGSIPEK